MTTILNAAPLKAQITKALKRECRDLANKGIVPFLKVILVGSDPASVIYTNNKKSFCEKIGARCEILELSENISETELRKIISDINLDSSVNGCLIQLPLPGQLKNIDISSLVTPEKDIDGLHPQNIFSLYSGNSTSGLIPCTPKGIITLLNYYGISLEGKSVVVIGRSQIVGKPLSLLLSQMNATVTICHSKTKNLELITRSADIIISAVGKSHFLTSTHFKHDQSQVVIDVGVNRLNFGNIVGDVNFAEVEPLVSAITPVPGGIGPMTIVSLADNLIKATKNQKGIHS